MIIDRRRRVVDALRAILDKIISKVEIEGDSLKKLERMTDEIRHLFDEDTSEFLKSFLAKARRLAYVGSRLDELPRGEERDELAREDAELLAWFSGPAREKLGRSE